MVSAGAEHARRLEAIERICSWLRVSVYRHGDRATWLAEDESDFTNPSFAAIGPNLYSGTSGVALFLLEAADLGIEDAGDLAAAALKSAVRQASRIESSELLGLHTGIPGILLALASANVRGLDLEITNSDPTGSPQSALLELLQSALSNSITNFDIVGGAAGTVVGLLAVRDYVDCGTAVHLAEHAGDWLLQCAKSVPGGLSWHPPGMPNELPLTGFSHGASGPGAAFAELMSATGDRKWGDSAKAAFGFERKWFYDSVRNWVDLREITRTSTRGSFNFATSWCHGAPGIGLSRARASTILNDSSLVEECHVAMSTTVDWLDSTTRYPTQEFGLCHGVAGNAYILLECLEILETEEWRNTCEQAADYIAEHVLQSTFLEPSESASPGLMTGWAGVGIFLLRTIRPLTFSPLYPTHRIGDQ